MANRFQNKYLTEYELNGKIWCGEIYATTEKAAQDTINILKPQYRNLKIVGLYVGEIYCNDIIVNNLRNILCQN